MTHYTARTAHTSADSAWTAWLAAWRAAKRPEPRSWATWLWRVLRGGHESYRETWELGSTIGAVYYAARDAYLCSYGKPA